MPNPIARLFFFILYLYIIIFFFLHEIALFTFSHGSRISPVSGRAAPSPSTLCLRPDRIQTGSRPQHEKQGSKVCFVSQRTQPAHTLSRKRKTFSVFLKQTDTRLVSLLSTSVSLPATQRLKILFHFLLWPSFLLLFSFFAEHCCVLSHSHTIHTPPPVVTSSLL